jgi:hypothetical protein
MMCYVCETPNVSHTHGDIGFCGGECLDKYKLLRMLATYPDKGLTKPVPVEIPEGPDNDNFVMPVVWVAIPQIECDITFVVNQLDDNKIVFRPASYRDKMVKFYSVEQANKYKNEQLAQYNERWRFELWALSALPVGKRKR